MSNQQTLGPTHLNDSRYKLIGNTNSMLKRNINIHINIYMVVESYISLMYSKHTFFWFLILYIPFTHEMYAQVTYMYGIQQLIYQAPYSD